MIKNKVIKRDNKKTKDNKWKEKGKVLDYKKREVSRVEVEVPVPKSGESVVVATGTVEG